MTRSRYELLFEVLLQEAGITDFVDSYKFALPRKWELDFAWPASAQKLAVEIDGGRWKAGGGRHGGDGDKVKQNTALTMGWRVLHFSPAQVTDEPATCIAFVRMML